MVRTHYFFCFKEITAQLCTEGLAIVFHIKSIEGTFSGLLFSRLYARRVDRNEIELKNAESHEDWHHKIR